MRISHQRTTYAALLPAIFLVLMLSLGTSLFAQSTTGNIRGTVISADDGIPMAEVPVELSHTGSPNQTKTSDDNGNFAFLNLPVGKYKAKVQFPGFKSFKSTIHVEPGRTIDLPIGLKLSE